MTLRGSENGGRDSYPNSFSILIVFGPISPAVLLRCHHARAQVRANHVPLIFVWTHEILALGGKNAVLGERRGVPTRIKSTLLRGSIPEMPIAASPTS